jgi:hypothetical protein
MFYEVMRHSWCRLQKIKQIRLLTKAFGLDGLEEDELRLMSTARNVLFLTAFAMLCQSASALDGRALLAALANCNPLYFREMGRLHPLLHAQSGSLSFNGTYVHVSTTKSKDELIAPVKLRAPVSIGQLKILGLVDGLVTDEFDGSKQYTWGIWVNESIGDAAKVVNTHLEPGRRAQKIHDHVYVRSEHSMPFEALGTWNVTQPLRYGTPPHGAVAKGLVIEELFSTLGTTMTWVTCNLHGRAIPGSLLTNERPDLADSGIGR